MNKQIQDAVLGYVSKESVSERLGVGEHTVRVSAYKVLHSRIKWDGSDKESLPEFADATPQLGVELRDKKGRVAWHRFNIYGYKRFEELTDEQQGSDEYAKVVFGETAYACKLNKKTNQLVRIRDDRRTADAASFIDQFMAAAYKTGMSVGNAMEQLIAEKTEINITIDQDEYDGKDQLKVSKFNRAKVLVGDEFGE